MPRVALAIFVIAIWIYAFIDCARTDRSKMPGRLPKGIWLVMTAIPVIGSVLWIGFSLRARFAGTGGYLTFGRPRPESDGPIAPDDDPEFLARLDAQNRFHEWEREQAEREREDDDGKEEQGV